MLTVSIDNEDCISYIEALPICADPSWVLWRADDHPFCCKSGEIGFEAIDQYRSDACGPADLDIEKSKLGSTVCFPAHVAYNYFT